MSRPLKGSSLSAVLSSEIKGAAHDNEMFVLVTTRDRLYEDRLCEW